MWLERLVAGLDDDQVALECERLDAGEVIPLALTDLAERLAPLAPDLGSDALVFVVLAQDEIGSHVWSLTAAAVGSDGLRVQRGRPAPAARRAAHDVPRVPVPARGHAHRRARGRGRPARRRPATRRSSRVASSRVSVRRARCLVAAPGQ